MDEKEEKGNWMFPKFFKVAFCKDPELGIGARILSFMGGAGLIFLEPIAKAGAKMGLTKDD